MSKPSDETYVLPAWLRSWEQFWFTPADPSLLGAMRLACGMIVVYVLFAYSFNLQDFMGEHAWHDLKLRMTGVREWPAVYGTVQWSEHGALPEPNGHWQILYKEKYYERWGNYPPPPYPAEDPDEVDYLNDFRRHFNVDVRAAGGGIPKTQAQKDYAEDYIGKHGLPPPAYPESEAEKKEIEDYMARWKVDPRLVHAKGLPIFSLWFHVTDPDHQAVIHALIVVVAFLFMIGFCTRITSALTWFGFLCYVHRNPSILFGVDTMITIMLFYLMISPCGAWLSLDRVILRWWATAKPGIVQGWFRFWKRPVPDASAIAPATPVPEVPTPSVCANVAIRLLQVHVCIIYLMAGLSKLLGHSWWNGTAIWYTLANYEFVPMQSPLYVDFLLLVGKNHLIYEAFITGGGIFTLAFEIGYAFCIWRPKLRWVFLGAAILLHGGIGLFMGLRTFSLIMLVMNMAFLRKEEVLWVFSRFKSKPAVAAAVPEPTPELVAVTAITKK